MSERELIELRVAVHRCFRELGVQHFAFAALVEAKRVLGGVIIERFGDEAFERAEEACEP